MNKKKIGNRRPAAGLSFSATVAAKTFTKQPTAFMTVVMPALVLFAGVSGALFCLITSYNLSCDYMAVFAASAIGSVGFTLLYRAKRVGAWTFPVAFGVFLALLAVLKDTIIGMGANAWNAVLLNLSSTNVKNVPAPFRGVPSYPSLTVLWVMVVLFLCITLGYCIVRRPLFLPVVLLTVPFMEVGLFYVRSPAVWAFALLLCCLLSQLAVVLAAGRRRGKGKRNAKRVCAPYTRQLAAPVSLILCLTMAVCLVGSQITVSLSDYQRPELFETLRVHFKDFDWMAFLNLPSRGISEGHFREAGNLRYDYQTDLKIEMPRTSKTLYFKGYTGSVYTKNGWEQLSDDRYTSDPLFLRDESAGLTGYQRLNAFYSQYAGQRPRSIRVTPVRAGTKYAFAPYLSFESPETQLQYDQFMRYTGNESSYSVFYNDDSAVDSFPYDTFLSPYAVVDEERSQYVRFMFDNYTQVPAELQNKLISTLSVIFAEETENVYSYNSIEVQLRQYFSDHTTYTLSPGRTPDDKDFVDYFLYENQKGYCTHYATAATLLLRAGGIPARYVEGYVVEPDEFTDAQQKQDVIAATRLGDGDAWVTEDAGEETYYSLEIDDSKRHAWVEVYDITRGWVPLEVTPGFEGNSVPGAQTSSSPSESSAPSSSRPSVSSTPSSSRAPQEGTRGSGGPVTVAIGIFAGILALMLLLLLILARQTVVERRRQKSFHTSDENQNVLHLYAYLCKLLGLAGVSNASAACYEPELLCGCFPFLSREECDRCMELVLKARFSGQPVSLEERKTVSRLVLAVRKQLYADKNFIGKLWMRYGRCL